MPEPSRPLKAWMLGAVRAFERAVGALDRRRAPFQGVVENTSKDQRYATNKPKMC